MFSAILLLILVSFQVDASEAAQAAHGREQMVVTAQHLATQVGNDILNEGGNAVDAAVAVGYALAVVHPCCGNIGGGGFMTVSLASGRELVLDFRETAPGRGSPNMFLDKNGEPVPGLSREGYLAVAVPGTVLGLETAREKYGTLSRQRLLEPAIRLAEQGFILQAGDVDILRKATKAFRSQSNVSSIFLNNGRPYQVGERLIQKQLAQTLRRVSEHGAKAFYRGAIAEKLVTASQTNGGILSKGDLANYDVETRQPFRCSYRGHEIISAPLPSSGGPTLCRILAALEADPIGASGFHSVRTVHEQVAAMGDAFALRATLGDSDHTTHYSIVDRWGNAVAVTYTINSYFGAKRIAGDTGFFLNNEMDDFATVPGQPNQFGLVHTEANAVAPHKRPLSSMSPSLVKKDGKLRLVLGSPGGPRIITTVLAGLVNIIDHAMDPAQAVAAPRFHYQAWPDTVFAEQGAFSRSVRQSLTQKGYSVKVQKPWGALELIQVTKSGLIGINDPRRPAGLAIGK